MKHNYWRDWDLFAAKTYNEKSAVKYQYHGIEKNPEIIKMFLCFTLPGRDCRNMYDLKGNRQSDEFK